MSDKLVFDDDLDMAFSVHFNVDAYSVTVNSDESYYQITISGDNLDPVVKKLTTGDVRFRLMSRSGNSISLARLFLSRPYSFERRFAGVRRWLRAQLEACPSGQ